MSRGAPGGTGGGDEMFVLLIGLVSGAERKRSLSSAGRVDGLTCQAKCPDGPTVIVSSRTSGNVRIGPGLPWSSTTGEVSVLNALCRRSTVPGGALPSKTPCLAASAVFSSARKYAARLPLPASDPAPWYSSTTSL